MTPYGTNWALFIGAIILAVLGLSFLVFLIVTVIIWSLLDGYYLLTILIIGAVLFFSGLIYHVWTEPQ